MSVVGLPSNRFEAREELISRMSAESVRDLLSESVSPDLFAQKIIQGADAILARMGKSPYHFVPIKTEDCERISELYDDNWRVSRVIRVNPLIFYHPEKNRVQYLKDYLFKNVEGFDPIKVVFSICGFDNNPEKGDSIYLNVVVWFDRAD